MADNFSNSESLCRSDASHQVLAKSNPRFGRRCCLKNFKMAAILDTERNVFSNSESLCHCDASHQVLAQSNSRFGRCPLKNFKNLGYRNRTTLAILNLYVTAMPPIKFWLNPTYPLGGDVV